MKYRKFSSKIEIENFLLKLDIGTIFNTEKCAKMIHEEKHDKTSIVLTDYYNPCLQRIVVTWNTLKYSFTVRALTLKSYGVFERSFYIDIIFFAKESKVIAEEYEVQFVFYKYGDVVYEFSNEEMTALLKEIGFAYVE